MRTFLIFLALFAAGFAVMAVASYPVYQWLIPHYDVAFHRVGTRLGMLTLLVGFALVAKRLSLADRASLGFGLPRAEFIRETGLGVVLGIATMLPIAAIMVWLDLRKLRDGITLDILTLRALLVQGAISGLAVALIEETFLRGAMLTGIARESGTRTAIVLSALLYAATHFMGRTRIAAADVDPTSGITLLQGTLAAFANPSTITDAFLCLTLVGVLLGMVRAINGNVAACIGLHAGWVWVITFLRETSVPDETQSLRFLLSQFDGVVGWLVAAWTVVIGYGLHAFYARRRKNSGVLAPQ